MDAMKKKVLITGASGLIGSELVREFIERGYEIYGFDLKPNPDLKHPDYTFFKCDLSKEAQVKAAFKKIKALDVLINNAAKSNPTSGDFQNLSLKQWEDSTAINLTSFFLMIRASLPLLKKSQGSIINMSSTRHMMSEAHTELYTLAKGGVDALTRALAISLAHQVRVNSISPGWIADPKEKRKPQDHKQHPAGRVGRPADIASMALYLASAEAGFITGQDFVVDGGMTAKMIYT
jgi:NAD(P)-dependent dehydrogenase (short-subunit alcohol dehydrogenase family)